MRSNILTNIVLLWITQANKNAFYEAEKSLFFEYIIAQDFERLTILLNAIDNKQFKDESDHGK